MPDWKEVVRTRLKTLRLQGTKESALSEELSQHLEDHYRDLRSGGDVYLRDAGVKVCAA